ncbi:MAG: glycosyltransferase [Chloroflexi bacterium]|nr:glycosyltransferase [Chloroflexota bacterium]
MRLAIVSPFPPEISGVGQYGARVAQGLASSGAFESVTVLANRVRLIAQNAKHAEIENLPPISGSSADSAVRSESTVVRRVWARDWAGSSPAILGALADLAPDAIWFNLGLSVFGRSRWANVLGLATPMLARARGWPTVVTLHEIFEAVSLHDLGAANGRLTYLGGRAVTQMLLRADTVCFTLRRYVAEVERRYGAKNLAHVPVGAFDPPEFLPLPNPRREILIFATYAPYKGLPLLLDAFADLQARDRDLRLTIAGGDHPRFPGYLESIRRLRGRGANIHWLGPVPEADLRALFGQSSVVALPYMATTGASSVIHRAAAYGRPVVVSDLPDVRAMAAEEGLWLEYVPAGDRAALARSLADLLADRPRREAMARHNLAAMQKMTLADTCAAYVTLFQQAVRQTLKR